MRARTRERDVQIGEEEEEKKKNKRSKGDFFSPRSLKATPPSSLFLHFTVSEYTFFDINTHFSVLKRKKDPICLRSIEINHVYFMYFFKGQMKSSDIRFVRE